MTKPSVELPSAGDAEVAISDYDADGYDYQRFWDDRAYEDWAESQVIRRCLRTAGGAPWLVDLGGGFGRHLQHYSPYARRLVLVDYSWTNLRAAEARVARDPDLAQRVHLVRANLYQLPFHNDAFDVGVTIRVLHHLANLDSGLREMSRVVRRRWLLDVPNKHHLVARLRALIRGDWSFMVNRDPHELGTPDEPYRNYHVGAVRETLRGLGWQPTVAASVANLRSWERACPHAVRGVARPVVHSAELVGQSLGRAWWGPSQWLWMTRATANRPAGVTRNGEDATMQGAGDANFTALMACPLCGGTLQWGADSALCDACSATYRRCGHIWDFVAS